MKLYDWITLTGLIALVGVLGNATGGLLDAPFIWHRFGGIIVAAVVLVHAGFVLYLRYGKKSAGK